MSAPAHTACLWTLLAQSAVEYPFQLNDNHRLRTGVASMAERGTYCAKPLNEYPLIMSDDPEQTVYM